MIEFLKTRKQKVMEINNKIKIAATAEKRFAWIAARDEEYKVSSFIPRNTKGEKNKLLQCEIFSTGFCVHRGQPSHIAIGSCGIFPIAKRSGNKISIKKNLQYSCLWWHNHVCTTSDYVLLSTERGVASNRSKCREIGTELGKHVCNKEAEKSLEPVESVESFEQKWGRRQSIESIAKF